MLTQGFSQRPTPETDNYWGPCEEDNDNYDEDQTCEDYKVPPPSRKHRRHNVLDDEDEEEQEEEAFNTPESSGARALFITQPDPEPFHDDGTLTRAQKGKTPQPRKKATSTSNVWQSLGVDIMAPSTSRTTRGAKTRATVRRGRGTATAT